jgi:Raf kinase inhibitor-like YbhB/YbcL family protein
MKWGVLLLAAILLVGCSQELEVVDMKLTITSPTFGHEGTIPAKYTCDGEDINPEIDIRGTPVATKSIVLIMDDPDAPVGTWDHWVVWNIPAETTKIEENSKPGTEGLNSWKKHSYGGPCPPSGTHRYFFKVYALDVTLTISEDSDKKAVEEVMKGHILAQGELMGKYSRG